MSAPTLEWLRELHHRKYGELAEDIAHALIYGSRLYTIEMYESAITRTETLYPGIHLTRLCPWAWTPLGVMGEAVPDRGTVGYRCSAEAALVAGLLSAEMLPQGRKRHVDLEDMAVYRVDRAVLPYTGIEVSAEVSDDMPDTHPLATFRPSVIRSAEAVRQPRVRAAAVLTGLRLVVDNTGEART
jgi:hypothetical protein